MSKAIYPGSFDPITFGHLDIIKRASVIFEDLTVLVLYNKQKNNSLFSVDNRVNMIKDVLGDMGLSHVRVDTHAGLLIDYARDTGTNVLVRGLRGVSDFDYEMSIAQVNHTQYQALETVFLAASLEHSYLSSTMVREFASYGGDITKFVPQRLVPIIQDRFAGRDS